MRRTRAGITLVLLCLTVAAGVAGAGGRREEASEASTEQVDYLGIAAVMIRDGNLDRAEEALDQVDPTRPDVDRARYHTLRGLLSLRAGENDGAVTELRTAIDNGQNDPAIQVYLAQAYFLTERYREVLAAVDAIPNLTSYPSLYGLRAASYWNLDNWSEALSTLERAGLIFPDRIDFMRQRIGYLLELNLTQAASELSLEYLEQAPQSPDTYITIGEALRRGGQTDTAIQVLEMARLQFFQNEQVRLLLANAYLEKGMTKTAARIIEEAAAYNYTLNYEAAELYRRAGDLDRALYLNSQVADASRKVRQRFNILLMKGRYEEAVALEPRLFGAGATDDDTIRYSLAYAYYRNGQYDRSVEYLQGISSPDVFSQAVELRQIIERSRS